MRRKPFGVFPNNKDILEISRQRRFSVGNIHNFQCIENKRRSMGNNNIWKFFYMKKIFFYRKKRTFRDIL